MENFGIPVKNKSGIERELVMDKEIKELLDAISSEENQEKLKRRKERRKNRLGSVYEDIDYELENEFYKKLDEKIKSNSD